MMIGGWRVTAGVGHMICSDLAALCVSHPLGFIYERVRVFIEVLFITSDI